MDFVPEGIFNGKHVDMFGVNHGHGLTPDNKRLDFVFVVIYTSGDFHEDKAERFMFTFTKQHALDLIAALTNHTKENK